MNNLPKSVRSMFFPKRVPFFCLSPMITGLKSTVYKHWEYQSFCFWQV